MHHNWTSPKSLVPPPSPMMTAGSLGLFTKQVWGADGLPGPVGGIGTPCQGHSICGLLGDRPHAAGAVGCRSCQKRIRWLRGILALGVRRRDALHCPSCICMEPGHVLGSEGTETQAPLGRCTINNSNKWAR